MDSMRPQWRPPTKCVSSRPCAAGRRSIRQQLCTWYFNWRIETLEMRVMRKVIGTMNWMVLALLVVTTVAAAQQSASAPQNPQPVAATQPSQTQSGQPQSNLAPPTTMDQVVDRVVMREKELVKFLSPRTPIVETYLQNLTQDPQLGPIPQEDHYFLGRMDFSESIDRSDFLEGKGKSDK